MQQFGAFLNTKSFEFYKTVRLFNLRVWPWRVWSSVGGQQLFDLPEHKEIE